jgi:multiple sugar transport system substrate-binding protein
MRRVAMRNGRRVVTTLACLAILAAACTAGGGSNANTTQVINPNKSHAPVTLELWTFFTSREFNKFYGDALQRLHQQFPWLTIKAVPGKQQDDVTRAINSGTAPDVAMECCPDDSAKLCSTGAWIDLNPFIRGEHMDISKIIPAPALAYTGFKGDQCSLPVLTDAYGLYYNTDMFKAAHIKSPPKTYSELLADAKKLTKFNSDGSIKIAGFNALPTGYEISNFENGVYSNTQWYAPDGKSALGTDRRWADLFEFQKKLVDAFGFDNLQKWYASVGGPNSEFSPSNAFEQGKLAMNFDGEWRVSFIHDDKAKIHYATAPFPVADDQPELYGAGQIGGTIIGIPRDTPHQPEAWEVVKFLATNTQAQESLAEALKNVPTTFPALKDPALTSDPHFATFLKIFANPHSRYKPITTLGTGDVSLMNQFVEKFVAGKVSDLNGGLKQVADQIDKQKELG